MAHVVLAHGISHELDSADTIENEWTPARAGGGRNAGFADVADRLWRRGLVADGFEVRAAFYGGLFREAGAQGGCRSWPAPRSRGCRRGAGAGLPAAGRADEIPG